MAARRALAPAVSTLARGGAPERRRAGASPRERRRSHLREKLGLLGLELLLGDEALVAELAELADEGEGRGLGALRAHGDVHLAGPAAGAACRLAHHLPRLLDRAAELLRHVAHRATEIVVPAVVVGHGRRLAPSDGQWYRPR